MTSPVVRKFNSRESHLQKTPARQAIAVATGFARLDAKHEEFSEEIGTRAGGRHVCRWVRPQPRPVSGDSLRMQIISDYRSIIVKERGSRVAVAPCEVSAAVAAFSPTSVRLAT